MKTAAVGFRTRPLGTRLAAASTTRSSRPGRACTDRPTSDQVLRRKSKPRPGRWRHCDSVLKSRGGDSDEEDWVSLEAAFAKWRQIAM